jgi:hypothetical protein
MATYYKYAERSADSQVNWAEVGKSMSDMLANETRIREQKKAAIDAASREFGQTLANPPQGEHKGANQWALEYADNASQFMLMQDRLLKSGQMKLKDYTVARQNILDGTDQAFNLAKEYQANFADKMERYKTDKSQDLEQWLMAQAEGYSDFNKSELYINPTDGTLSVAMKEKKTVDGKDVYVMNKNPNEFTSISTLRNQIAGKYDKFNTNAATDAFVSGLGEEVTSAIAKTASLSSGGLIESIEDIRSRKDIDPATKQVLYKFADSETQFIKSALVNPYDRLSVLTNSKKFAPNGEQYSFTYDEAEAKANPAKVLLRKDPKSGQPTPEFSKEQMTASEDFMRTELRAKYTRKQELKPTPQNQLQEHRPPSQGEIDLQAKQQEAKNFAQNLAYATTGTPAQIDTALKYLSQKTGKVVERTPTGITVSNADGTGKSTFGFTKDGSLTNPKAFGRSIVGAFSTGLPEDMIIKNYDVFVGGKPLETVTSGKGFEEVKKAEDPIVTYGKFVNNILPDNKWIQGVKPKEVVSQLNSMLSGLNIEADTPWSATNAIYLKTKDGVESPNIKLDNIGSATKQIKDWIKLNAPGKTPVEKAANIKALIKSGIITGGSGELDD